MLTWIISSALNIEGVWYYYVPISLLILLLFLLYAQSIDKAYARSIIAKSPKLFDSVEETIFINASSVFIPMYRLIPEPQRIDKASAVGWITWVTIPYCIFAGIKGEWIVAFLTTLPILYVYLGSVLFCCFYSGDLKRDSDAIFIIMKKSNEQFLNIDEMSAEYYLSNIAKKLRFPKPTGV